MNKKWNHERNIYEEEEDTNEYMDGVDRDPLDEEESPFALSFITRRLLSESSKIVKNSRIVVVGGSDTGISFIEALLSISYLHFTNIFLISPGGLPHHHFEDKKDNLKAYSTSYTRDELKRLMLENRIKVINARCVDIDRGDKFIILHDGKVVPYDSLILTMGLQEKTLSCLNYISRGITPIPQNRKRMEGLISIDDPSLYQHLRIGGSLIPILTNRKKPENVVLYGRTIHNYCCIQGLLERGVKPANITLVIPEKECHVREFYNEGDEYEMSVDLPIINPDAFEDSYIEEKVHSMLEIMGIKIYKHSLLVEIFEDDNNSVKSVLFKRLDISDVMPEEEEEEDEDRNSNQSDNEDGEGDEENEGEDGQVRQKRKRNELELPCKVFITAGHRDVDPDVFNSLHNNGLVYNGRLIVHKNF